MDTIPLTESLKLQPKRIPAPNGGEVFEYPVVGILAYALARLEKEPWHDKIKSSHGIEREGTPSIFAKALIHHCEHNELLPAESRHIKEAEEIANKVVDLPPSEFHLTLQQAVCREHVPQFKIGLVIYAIRAVQRHEEKQQADSTSKHLGSPGGKIVAVLYYVGKDTSYHEEYGTTFTYHFKDGHGNLVDWRTAKDIAFTPEEPYHFQATVKEHKGKCSGRLVTRIIRPKHVKAGADQGMDNLRAKG